MNRQEIISQIKLIQAGLTQDDNNKSKRRLDLVIEELEKPMSLADFLGWKEGVIYTDGISYYKIQNNSIFHKTKGKIQQVWTLSGYNDYLNFYNKFRELEKVKEKRYNLILEKGYRKLFDLLDNEKYLNMDIEYRGVFHSKYSNNNSKYQAQFTLEEIEEIKRIYDIDLCIYDVVRVQE